MKVKNDLATSISVVTVRATVTVVAAGAEVDIPFDQSKDTLEIRS